MVVKGPRIAEHVRRTPGAWPAKAGGHGSGASAALCGFPHFRFGMIAQHRLFGGGILDLLAVNTKLARLNQDGFGIRGDGSRSGAGPGHLADELLRLARLQHVEGDGVLTLLGQPGRLSFADALYFSVITIATVGYGDITPSGALVRGLASIEVVLGLLLLLFGFSEIMRTRDGR